MGVNYTPCAPGTRQMDKDNCPRTPTANNCAILLPLHKRENTQAHKQYNRLKGNITQMYGFVHEPNCLMRKHRANRTTLHIRASKVTTRVQAERLTTGIHV